VGDLDHELTLDTQGGKNRRRGKNENDNEKRELTFKEEGQGTLPIAFPSARIRPSRVAAGSYNTERPGRIKRDDQQKQHT
jgi:hypothetical protein